MRKKLYKLAADHGCEIIYWPATKRLECWAPDGKVFRSCDSHAINFGGSTFGQDPVNWKGAYSFFADEISQGFDNE
jgi:hypothetical protein